MARRRPAPDAAGRGGAGARRHRRSRSTPTGPSGGRRCWRWWSSLALQVGVNYANDYSDGIRGTDDDRVGPLRLVGSGLATPRAVKTAAFAAFGVAAVAGLVLAATTAWWLVAVGVVSILAAWFYTGGSTPYGYHALGEVMVFVFFGLVAVIGTTYVQTETWQLGRAVRRASGSARWPARSWW